MKKLTQMRLKQVLEYEPMTNSLTWKVNLGNRIKTGTSARVTGHRGYRRIEFAGRQFRISRIAYLYITGEWPSKILDHLNQ